MGFRSQEYSSTPSPRKGHPGYPLDLFVTPSPILFFPGYMPHLIGGKGRGWCVGWVYRLGMERIRTLTSTLVATLLCFTLISVEAKVLSSEATKALATAIGTVIGCGAGDELGRQINESTKEQ